MGVKASPRSMERALQDIASGQLSAIGANSIADAFVGSIRRAREGLAICVHCRDQLIGRCKECDQLHARACCACQDCMCACSGSNE